MPLDSIRQRKRVDSLESLYYSLFRVVLSFGSIVILTLALGHSYLSWQFNSIIFKLDVIHAAAIKHREAVKEQLNESSCADNEVWDPSEYWELFNSSGEDSGEPSASNHQCSIRC